MYYRRQEDDGRKWMSEIQIREANSKRPTTIKKQRISTHPVINFFIQVIQFRLVGLDFLVQFLSPVTVVPLLFKLGQLGSEFLFPTFPLGQNFFSGGAYMTGQFVSVQMADAGVDGNQEDGDQQLCTYLTSSSQRQQRRAYLSRISRRLTVDPEIRHCECNMISTINQNELNTTRLSEN